MPKYSGEAFGLIDGYIKKSYPEYYEEITGIAEVIDLNPDLVLMINFVHEVSSHCTSIIVRDKNGTIIHERNLDFGEADTLRKVSYIAKFMKGDQYLFDAVMFAGSTGVFTGEKRGSFSISENIKKPTTDNYFYELIYNVGLLFSGHKQIAWLIRETFIECENW